MELVIFDCDGVLVDSERLAVKVDVMVLGALGWSLTEAEVIERFVGLSNESYRRAVEACRHSLRGGMRASSSAQSTNARTVGRLKCAAGATRK
jgi:beta-phosphoglucomutase-like phosphatase (HAD superfamily)